jgi:two-component system cell cycle sensor histidine kinase PleC
LLHGGATHYGLAVLGVGLCGWMIHLGRTTYVGARDLFLTREDKNDLIEQLAAAKIESDKARHRAEAASQAKSEFLANMSHELRTPLNAILGFSEIMKGEVFGPLGSPQYIEYAGHIHGSGRHLLGLINDVLDLARIEAGRFVVRAVEINLREAVGEALTQFEVRAAQANIRMKVEIENGLPLLLADERAIRQVLLNLISNAVKFTPGGGTVTVFARRSALGGMEFGVSDSGCGIDPADIDTVFEAFGQGQHDVAARDKGTGLGLPIVRGLIEAHNGKVKLTSELGKGTTVTCTFPRERLTAPQPVPIRLATVI